MHCTICHCYGCHDSSHQAMIARGSMNGDVCNLCGHKIDDWRDHSMACSQRHPVVVIHNWDESCINAHKHSPQWGSLMADYQVVFGQVQTVELFSYGEVGRKEVHRRMDLDL